MRRLRQLWYAVTYLVWLAWQVPVQSMKLARDVLTPGLEVSPSIIEFPLRARSTFETGSHRVLDHHHPGHLDARHRRGHPGSSAQPLRPLPLCPHARRRHRRVGGDGDSSAALMRSMTEESASVVTSPTSRPSATSLSRRRMILPERVLGSSETIMIVRGLAIGPISLATWLRNSSTIRLLSRRPRGLGVLLAQDDEGDDGLAGGLVVGADDRRLGDLRVADQGRLDLGGGEAVAGDVHDVVDPAEQPDVAVLVLLGAVAGEVVLLGRSGSSRCRGSAPGRPRCRAASPATAW
jgi:hypothetical protein